MWIATETALWRSDSRNRTVGMKPVLVCAQLDAGDDDGPGSCMRALATDGASRIAVGTASEMAFSETAGETWETNTVGYPAVGSLLDGSPTVSKHDELCIKNEEFCIKNEELCIQK